MTGIEYYGSSIDLGSRVRDYYKMLNKKDLRPILADIRLCGITSFVLTVYVLPNHLSAVNFTVLLEQYYILTKNPLNNALLVAQGSPGGKWLAQINSVTQSIPVYLYDNDILIYKFDSTTGQNNNAATGTGIMLGLLRELLIGGGLYLERFGVSRVPHTPENINFINVFTAAEVLAIIKDHKLQNPVKRGRPKTTTPALTITSSSDGAVYEFDNIRSART